MLQGLFWATHLPAVITAMTVFFLLLARLERVWLARLLAVLGMLIATAVAYGPAMYLAWLLYVANYDVTHITLPLTTTVIVVGIAAVWLWLVMMRRKPGHSDLRGRISPLRPWIFSALVLLLLHVGAIWLGSSVVVARLEKERREAITLVRSLAPQASADDASPLYDKAFALLSVDPEPEVKPWSLDRDPAQQQPLPQELREYLVRHEQTLPLLRLAAAKPGWMMDRDYSQALMTMLSDMRPLRNIRAAARLLAWDAIAAAEDDDAMRAMDDIDAIYAMARQVDGHPEMVSKLVAVSLWSLSQGALERVLDHVQPAAERLASVTRSAVSPTTNLDRVIQMEEAQAIEAIVIALTGPPRSESWMMQVVGRPAWLQRLAASPFRLFLAEGDLAALKDSMTVLRAAINIADRPVPAALRELRARKRGRRHLLVQIFEPGVRVGVQTLFKSEAAYRSTRAGAAVAAYAADHDGRYPPSLDALLPAYLDSVPIDPYTNRPLRYRSSVGGAVTYSVGDDGEDDNGLDVLASPPGAFRNRDDGDIGFILRRPDPPAIKAMEPDEHSVWQFDAR